MPYTISHRAQYALVTAAILTASVIQLVRGYRLLIVVVGALGFLFIGNLTVYLAGSKQRALDRKRKRAYYAGTLLLLITCSLHAQLLGEPSLTPHTLTDPHQKKPKQQRENNEWMWQYGPPPDGGREHDLIQDPHFLPFLDQYLTAPQSFWGPQQEGRRKTLAETAYDFLALPGQVLADDQRYLTITGSVFHLRTSRGLLFIDLNEAHPLVVFAAIDWIRDSKTTDDPEAEYTLWLFPNKAPGPGTAPQSLPPALTRSLTRWMAQPVPGLGFQQHITAAILVDPDGTPHQIAIPVAAETEERAPIQKRR